MAFLFSIIFVLFTTSRCYVTLQFLHGPRSEKKLFTSVQGQSCSVVPVQAVDETAVLSAANPIDSIMSSGWQVACNGDSSTAWVATPAGPPDDLPGPLPPLRRRLPTPPRGFIDNGATAGREEKYTEDGGKLRSGIGATTVREAMSFSIIVISSCGRIPSRESGSASIRRRFHSRRDARDELLYAAAKENAFRKFRLTTPAKSSGKLVVRPTRFCSTNATMRKRRAQAEARRCWK